MLILIIFMLHACFPVWLLLPHVSVSLCFPLILSLTLRPLYTLQQLVWLLLPFIWLLLCPSHCHFNEQQPLQLLWPTTVSAFIETFCFVIILLFTLKDLSTSAFEWHRESAHFTIFGKTTKGLSTASNFSKMLFQKCSTLPR